MSDVSRSGERLTRSHLVTGLATYIVTEQLHKDGEVTIRFETTNPPRGLHSTLYEWHGKPNSLEGKG